MFRFWLRPWAALSAAAPLLAALIASGCGHPASKQECEQIFQRSAEIALKAKNISDKSEVSRYLAEARDAKGKAMLEQCVGKRITDKAVRCVYNADNAEELDDCLR